MLDFAVFWRGRLSTHLGIVIRTGHPDDAPLTLYPHQIVEEMIGVELIRPLPRNDLGEVIGGSALLKPVVRSTGPDAEEAAIILSFPAGLYFLDNKGRARAWSVDIRIEVREIGEADWRHMRDLYISANRQSGFYRQHRWKLPYRGRWEVRLTMLSDESISASYQYSCAWSALQTIRPEYPVAYPQPLGLVAMRIKASHQLSGALDDVSMMLRRVCPDWDKDAGRWIGRPTSNPASLYRFVLQHGSNPKPVPDQEIDLRQLEEWHEFCEAKGLTYNRVLDRAGTSLREVLTEIAAAGRAAPRHDGMLWGVVMDRPDKLVVDHISPRNSRDFTLERAYVEAPHAWIVKFQDEGNSFKDAERVIRRPGYEGEITLTETLRLPGITDPAQIWREGVRRFLEAGHRPDIYQMTQDGMVRVATRGDHVMLGHDVLEDSQWAGQVRSVWGGMIELDEFVRQEPGKRYGIRFRSFSGKGDRVGRSVLREVEAFAGESNTLTPAGSGPLPQAGDLVLFGELGRESRELVVTHIEATEDHCQIIRAVDAAPQIDEWLGTHAFPHQPQRASRGRGAAFGMVPVPALELFARTEGVRAAPAAERACLADRDVLPGGFSLSTSK